MKMNIIFNINFIKMNLIILLVTLLKKFLIFVMDILMIF